MDKELLGVLIQEARKKQNDDNLADYKAGAPMEASVGGIVIQPVADHDKQDISKIKPFIFSNSIDCPPENDIRDKKFNALELVTKAHAANMANAIGAIDIATKEGLLPAIILTHEEVNPMAVLDQCMDNYRRAEGLPGRKPSADNKKSAKYKEI